MEHQTPMWPVDNLGDIHRPKVTVSWKVPTRQARRMNRLTLRSPVDILAVVPYLLGFYPADSLVVLALKGTRVIFQVRADSPTALEINHFAVYLGAVTARQGATSAIVIGYGADEPTTEALLVLRAAIEAAGVPVSDALRSFQGRYWAYDRSDTCRETEGIEYDTSASRVAAAATYAGLTALPDRDALAESLSPAPGTGIEPEIDRAEKLLGKVAVNARQRRVAVRAATRDAMERYGGGGRLDDDEVAWLAVLIADARARDEAWQRLLSEPARDEHKALWLDVARRVPERFVPAPATLLALSAWRAGDGVTASIAAGRALEINPRYTLADLVLQAIACAIAPSALETLSQTPRGGRHLASAVPRSRACD